MISKLLKSTSLSVALAVTGASFAGPAQAAFVNTEQVMQAQSPAAQNRSAFLAAVAREDVSEMLGVWGVSGDEAAARIQAMSDAEIMQLASALPGEPAGQGAVGAIVGAVVFIFVVLLITDILGFTSVYGFVN